jgi:hypothetical protein
VDTSFRDQGDGSRAAALVGLTAGALAAFAVSALASASSPATPQPIVTIVRHGGLCAGGSECRRVLRITDTTISGDGYLPRRLERSARAAHAPWLMAL